MISYADAMRLKEWGFPQRFKRGDWCYTPQHQDRPVLFGFPKNDGDDCGDLADAIAAPSAPEVIEWLTTLPNVRSIDLWFQNGRWHGSVNNPVFADAILCESLDAAAIALAEKVRK